MKKALKIIGITFLAVVLVISGLIAGTKIKISTNNRKIGITAENFEETKGDKLHFLNTGSTDCILIESDGRFGLVDSGEDEDYPAELPNLKLTGYEKEVVQYIKEIAADEQGKVTLDFVIGTHSHSDHIGGFDTIINDPDITVLKGYLKVYNEKNISKKEVEKWDNQEVYDQMMKAMQDNSVEIIQDLKDVSFEHGKFNIKILNGEIYDGNEKIGENENSLAIMVEKDDKTALLGGDVNNLDGDEDRLASELGKINLLKPGHHGYIGSTSANWVKTLSPDISIITNSKNKSTPDVQMKLAFLGKSAVFFTVGENGIIATFQDDGEIRLSNEIMK